MSTLVIILLTYSPAGNDSFCMSPSLTALLLCVTQRLPAPARAGVQGDGQGQGAPGQQRGRRHLAALPILCAAGRVDRRRHLAAGRGRHGHQHAARVCAVGWLRHHPSLPADLLFCIWARVAAGHRVQAVSTGLLWRGRGHARGPVAGAQLRVA